jgi:hypothetical protein
MKCSNTHGMQYDNVVAKEYCIALWIEVEVESD